jgi:hypothetical protein
MKFNLTYIIIIIIIIGIIVYFLLKNKNNKKEKTIKPKINTTSQPLFKQSIEQDEPSQPFFNESIEVDEVVDEPVQPLFKKPIQQDKKEDNLNIDQILKKDFQYKDETKLTYADFNPEKVNKIVKTIQDFKKPYFTLDKKSKFKILDDEKYNDDISKIKTYIKDQDEYFKNLPQNEKAILQAYVSSDYQVFNKFLSKRKPILRSFLANGLDFEKIRKANRNLINETNPRILMNYFSTLLNKIIYEAPRLPIPLTVFRGTQDPYFLNELTLDENNQYTYKINTFLSTSLMPNVAAGINQQFINYKTQCCMSIINLPKDTRGLFKYNSDAGIGGFVMEELELLLPSGGELKLVGYTPKFTEYEVAFDDDDNVFDKTPEIDTYVWDYIPPKNDDYTIELFEW